MGGATTRTLAGSCLKMHSRHSSLEHISVGLKRSIGLKTSVISPGMCFFLRSISSMAVEGGLLKCVLLNLDESMSGWRPKSTKTGGLPKLSWEPQKPVPLGTMFRNGVECMSGILVFQDVVQDAEVMKQNEYFGEKSSMPNGMEIPAHAAEVLRKIKEQTSLKGAGWAGGDTWFGSMVTALEAKKCLNVDSTWIIKDNHAFYLMGALHAVIKAQFGTNMAGNWVTMMTTIDGVKMMVMAYAWSQKGISYFLSTCGSIEVSSVLC
jgi:hypothetical protein